MSQPPNILVVDDEQPIRRLLRTNLEAQGYRVDAVSTAHDALDRARRGNIDIVLLDLGLPDRDGLDLIAEIRRASRLPIVVISSRSQEETKVQALDLGADDYVTKPFAMGELFARIRAAMRHGIQDQGGEPVVEIDALRIDLTEGTVTRDGQPIKLSPVEYRLLKVLAIHAGRIMTHRQIVEQVWGRGGPSDPQYLRIYIRALRQKLEPDPARPAYVLTEPGVGYRLKRAEA
jgi:two-component system KDP operon response regulator KdpE